jgi:hypothetical protein
MGSRERQAPPAESARVREGKNLKGRFLGAVVGTVGKRVLTEAFVNFVKAIEARDAATAAGHA